MNGKARDMDYKFAIKVLSGTKVDTQSMHGNPKRYGYQNQYFYDIARNMAIQALKEKYENDKLQTLADVAPRSEVARELFAEFEGVLLRLAYLGADGNYHIRRMNASEATMLVDEYFELKKKYVKE